MTANYPVAGSTVDAEILKNLPNLPGFNLPQFKERYHKNQTWGVVNGQRIENQEGETHDRTKHVHAVRPKETWRAGSLPDSTSRAVFKQLSMNDHEHMKVPAWDALDRHVLRFYGYFKEAVVETNLEKYRVRKVTIYYYLEDDTCSVNEPKQDNSGIPQGTLIRRHKLPGPNGGYLNVEDLRIGIDWSIYGKKIRITSCDPFTREYYAHLGIEQDEPISDETDPFYATRQDVVKKEAKPPRSYEKLYREMMLGGGHINTDMQQFLEKDRKVLRFFAVMDDISTPQFERRPFILLFFLADDTVEIREMYPLNCGRDNFPIFFRRGKMARGRVEVLGPQSEKKKKEEFVHGSEWSVGQVVSLSGNQFFIYDADEFTRAYFYDDLGIQLEEKVDVQLPERAVPRAATPPYNGYGSWDDSMSSVIHLIPKAPQKDFKKLYDNEGKILRFTARFANPKPEDVNRLFVFNFHLFDDTLSIHEPPQRNLGIVTGRFLEKGVHLNMDSGDLFKIEDLLPGKVVSVFNHRFEMLDMDEYTRNHIANPNGLRRKFDLTVVMEKLRESMRQQFPLVRDIFRRFDADHDGVLTHAEFKKALEKFGFQLADDEVTLVMKHFDTRKDGQVSYNEFCDTLLDEDYTQDMLKTKPHVQTVHDPHYADRVMGKSIDREETNRVRKAVRELGDVVYQRHGTVPKLFKEFEKMTHGNTVSNVQIKKALSAIGITIKLEDIDRVILFMDPNADLGSVVYVNFFKTMMASFHDINGTR
jgi:hypothetical protein